MAGELLLLGATGQIGARVVARAAVRGEDEGLIALARDPDRIAASSRTRTVRFDLARPLPDLGSERPSNAIATVPVWLLPPRLEEIAAAGVRRLVCFSTTSVLGKADTRNAHERATVARAIAAEETLRDWADSARIELTILRPTLIYGAGRDRTVAAAARFIERFGFYPVHGAASGRRQPVHADDLAAAALAALESDTTPGRTYALGGGETLAYREMIARIFGALGRRPRIYREPFLPALLAIAGSVRPESELTADVARRMNVDLDFDDGTAARDFGYAPRMFLSGGRADLFGTAGQD